MESWVTLSQSSGSGNDSVNITLEENTSLEERSTTLRFTTAGGASVSLPITQAAAGVTYSDITITGFSYSTVSAAGGTVTPTLTYTQTWGYNGNTTGGGTITSGATVSYSGTNVDSSTGSVTVPSKGTTISEQTTYTTATVTVSLNGKTATADASVLQEANSATYGDITFSGTASVADIPASGGSVSTATGLTATQAISYTSGSSSIQSASITYSTVSADSLDTNVTSRTAVGTMVATATGNGGKTATMDITVYQEANELLSYDWDTAILTSNIDQTEFTYSGGITSLALSVLSGTGTTQYTSGAYDTVSVSDFSNVEVTVSSDVEWMEIATRVNTTSRKQYSITVDDNSDSARSGVITIEVRNVFGGLVTTESITITQESSPDISTGDYITITPDTLDFGTSFDPQTVQIESLQDWSLGGLIPSLFTISPSSGEGGEQATTVTVSRMNRSVTTSGSLGLVFTGGEASATLTINYDPVYLTVSSGTVTFGPTAYSATITVNSSSSWTTTYASNSAIQGAYTMTPASGNAGTTTVTFSNAYLASRDPVTLTLENAEGLTATVTLNWDY